MILTFERWLWQWRCNCDVAGKTAPRWRRRLVQLLRLRCCMEEQQEAERHLHGWWCWTTPSHRQTASRRQRQRRRSGTNCWRRRPLWPPGRLATWHRPPFDRCRRLPRPQPPRRRPTSTTTPPSTPQITTPPVSNNSTPVNKNIFAFLETLVSVKSRALSGPTSCLKITDHRRWHTSSLHTRLSCANYMHSTTAFFVQSLTAPVQRILVFLVLSCRRYVRTGSM